MQSARTCPDLNGLQAQGLNTPHHDPSTPHRDQPAAVVTWTCSDLPGSERIPALGLGHPLSFTSQLHCATPLHHPASAAGKRGPRSHQFSPMRTEAPDQSIWHLSFCVTLRVSRAAVPRVSSRRLPPPHLCRFAVTPFPLCCSLDCPGIPRCKDHAPARCWFHQPDNQSVLHGEGSPAASASTHA